MKVYKFVLLILLFDLIFSLSSCIDLRSEDEIVDDMMMELITTLDNKDEEKFKLLFANEKISSIENFDYSINELFNYYQGTYESKKNGGRGVDKDKHYEYKASWYNLSYDVTTTNDTYRIAIYWCTEYKTNNDMIGIWSFYIIKMSDSPTPEYSYRGDGLWTSGINIGKYYIEN